MTDICVGYLKEVSTMRSAAVRQIIFEHFEEDGTLGLCKSFFENDITNVLTTWIIKIM